MKAHNQELFARVIEVCNWNKHLIFYCMLYKCNVNERVMPDFAISLSTLMCF